MQIVPMQKKHLKNVMAIEKESFGIDSWSLQFFLSELKSDLAHYICVIDRDNKVAGYAGCRMLFEEAELVNICVAPPYRKLGLGKTMMRYFIDMWIDRKIQHAFLEVRVGNNAAIHMYKSFGFEIISTRKGYYKNGEDAYVMTLDINKLLNG